MGVGTGGSGPSVAAPSGESSPGHPAPKAGRVRPTLRRPMQWERETAPPGRLVSLSGGADVTDVRTFLLSCAWC
jgi:hypothetical protein